MTGRAVVLGASPLFFLYAKVSKEAKGRRSFLLPAHLTNSTKVSSAGLQGGISETDIEAVWG